MRPIRVVLVDDHAVVRSGYRRLIELETGMQVTAEFGDGESAYAWLTQNEADVLVLDLSMPGRGGIETLSRLKQRQPGLRALVFSMHDGAAMVTQALRAGADGYLTKNSSPDLLVDAILRVWRHELVLSDDVRRHAVSDAQATGVQPHLALTPREFEIFHRLAEGVTVDDIAQTLCLSPKTVANYQTVIRQKLGVESPVEMVRLAQQHGLVGR
ncbi:MAG: response regulator transcription factor [Burkholderiales bacterium]|nr:response regulator transcription factor [Burkholderiales bacterium]